MKLLNVLSLTIQSPIGAIVITSDGDAVTGIYMNGPPKGFAGDLVDGTTTTPVLRAASDQLHAYFRRELTDFDLPLAAAGSEFQQAVWSQLRRIPYGRTASYGELARRVGNEKASRAVGLANGRNPISIVVPCHRVIGSNGKLTGYAGGMAAKRWLLEHEAKVLGAGASGRPTAQMSLAHV